MSYFVKGLEIGLAIVGAVASIAAVGLALCMIVAFVAWCFGEKEDDE